MSAFTHARFRIVPTTWKAASKLGPASTTQKRTVSPGSDIAGNAWYADYPAASNFIKVLSCSWEDNYARFCNAAIDRRIGRAFRLQEQDPTAANEAWAALDRDLTDQAPWVPLFTPYSGDFVSKRVGNYQKHPFWGPLFGQLWVR
jgi:peptide/nickel transport system substrate-binding protein